MATDNSVLSAAMVAIASAYGKDSEKLDASNVLGWFERAVDSVQVGVTIDEAEISEALHASVKIPRRNTEINKRNLARWFEIPFEEFERTDPRDLKPEVLIRHLILEDQFRNWMEEWGYEVSIGEELDGEDGVLFTPDVYGKLDTLHGRFEVCINFVCTDPPSQYRVQALLETLEAYADERTEFKNGDLLVVVTPFSFGKQTTASLNKEVDEQTYSIVALQCDDLWQLQNARDPQSRLELLIEHVERSLLAKQNNAR